jgi:hypothetical protein
MDAVRDAAEPTEAALVVTFDPAAVLVATPQMFRLAAVASGISAILFEYVRSQGLYRQAGYPTMRAYARIELGVRSDAALRKARKAGVHAWTTIPTRCREVIAAVIADGLARALPDVPNLSMLYVLPRALRSASAPDGLLAEVLAGRHTLATLTRIARRGDTHRGVATDRRQPLDPTTEAKRKVHLAASQRRPWNHADSRRRIPRAPWSPCGLITIS